MKKLEFLPEDFLPCVGLKHRDANMMAAEIARNKFHSWLRDNSVRVYSMRSGVSQTRWAEFSDTHDTHTGLLIQIEEIPKPCEHELIIAPPNGISFSKAVSWKCANPDCSARLRPTGFEVVE